MGQNEVQIQDDCEEEPDWDLMSVLPMTQCSTKKYNSKIWEYFGQLMGGTVCVDNRNFYCLLCFQDRKFKQYSAATATSNFYVHLRTIHDLNIDRRAPTSSKCVITRQKTMPIIKRENIVNNENQVQISNEIESGSADYLEINADDDMYVEEISERYDEDPDLFVSIPERHVTNKRHRSKPYSPNTNTSLPLQIEESVNSEDYDQLFILSLIKEFRRIPTENREECKSEIMSVLRKYQTLELNSDEEFLTIEPAGSQSYTIITEIESAGSILQDEEEEQEQEQEQRQEEEESLDPEIVEYTFLDEVF